MKSAATKILSDNIPLLVDRLVARLISSMPSYARLEPAEVRLSVEGFARDLLLAVETNNSDQLAQRLLANTADRVTQGFSLSEYLRAMFMAPPVCREVVRELGP
ncbi:MAG: hypothetical protein ABI461_19010, partial [Polyangiaceae bacterium]